MRFAARTEFESTATEYGNALRAARERADFIDLTLSNPTRADLSYDAVDLRLLSSPAVLHYGADALGMRAARDAVAAQYAGISPDRIVLSASTSEAYGYLLRLLCDAGDEVLVPSPSYPLFDLLARMHDVEMVTYPLVYHDGWQIDPASLRGAVTSRTRAIVCIHPNNPTGHYCSAADRALLHDVAAEHELPLIVDEVFLEYAMEGGESTFARVDAPVLTFVLGGLSKALAMPGMKLAWTVACGAAADVSDAMERLEVIADTFLSVATPVQAALPAWLDAGSLIRSQLMERIEANLAALDSMIQGSSVDRLRVEGGWSAVLRVPAVEDDDVLAERLLREHDVAVHPGSLYGFAKRGWVVISLIVPSDLFAAGVGRLLGAFESVSVSPSTHAATVMCRKDWDDDTAGTA